MIIYPDDSDATYDFFEPNNLLKCNTTWDCPSWGSRAHCLEVKFSLSLKTGVYVPVYCNPKDRNDCPPIGHVCNGGVLSRGKCLPPDANSPDPNGEFEQCKYKPFVGPAARCGKLFFAIIFI